MRTQSLHHLGTRIAIIGPSSSGKSTLAERLGAAINVPVCHLDQIAHRHGSQWERVPHDEFLATHDDVIGQDRWVIEGNYSICMPARFDRATAVIWLDPPLTGCVWRYIKRTWHGDTHRIGHLPGAKDRFNPMLIKYTLQNYPKNRHKYRSILENYPQAKQLTFKKLVTLDDLSSL